MMGRLTYDKVYNYKKVLISYNIELKSCDNCAQVQKVKGVVHLCNAMARCGIKEKVRIVDINGMCDLWGIR
ncbi:MAG: hypothetical protein FWC97_00450 [Treponema sp.]|nr:hypothetical protein [Treponema sp.]